jgi:ABC-type lipoprotein export system ATPase subunit
MEVSLVGVKKAFGSETVLDIPELLLKSGEQCVVTGGSGQGKTTLLNLMGGFWLPDAGDISIGGTHLSGLSEAERDQFRARHVGFIFQSFNLLPELTIFDNIRIAAAFSGKEDGQRILRLLEHIGLKEKAGAYPRTLSMGQRQRAAVARAIIGDPGLILADEPTGSLDTDNKDNILKLIRDLCSQGGRTLVLVSHDESVAARFERRICIADLKKGRT